MKTTVSDLKPSPYNPRKISKAALEALAQALREFGDLGGVVVNTKTGHMVSGHQRVKALDPVWAITKAAIKDATGTTAAGFIETPHGRLSYREVHWPLAKEKAANLAANKHGGTFDMTAVRGILSDLDDGSMNLDLTGFLTDERRALLGGADPGGGAEDSVPAVPTKATTKPGELIIMGGHRLYCGDSTDKKAWAALTAGQDKASLVFTDPPYGVSYEAKSGKFDVIQGDKNTGDALAKMLIGAFKAAVAFAAPEAAWYIWHASSTREDFSHALRAAGLVERQYIIWAKPAAAFGHADYHWAHEPCFYAALDGQRPVWYGDRAQNTVWRATLTQEGGMSTTLGQAGLLVRDGRGGELWLQGKAPKSKKLRAVRLEPGQTLTVSGDDAQNSLWEVGRDGAYAHPTQKPVELARRAILNSTAPSAVVLDMFLGSGTTLIGAELTGRRCLGFELDPKYADVITSRWEKITGRKATRK